MRWGAAAGAWCAALGLLAAARAAPSTVANETFGGGGGEREPYAVTAVAFEEGPWGGAALGELLAEALRTRGVAARAAAAPDACDAAADGAVCLRGVLAALARGALLAALVPAPRAPPPPELRDAGLEELADAAPPARRACFLWAAAAPAPRSLLDLADAALAARLAFSREELENASRSLADGGTVSYYCEDYEAPATSNKTCAFDESAAATIVTGEAGEAVLAARTARALGLRARAVAAGAGRGAALAAALPRPALLCGRALAPPPAARRLGPPPCDAADCPFEARRLLKLVNARELARSPGAARVLARVALSADELRALARRAREAGPAAAAREALRAHPEWARAAAELRVAAMLPASTRREAYDAPALRAAAELAELDARDAARPFYFKVETLDDECSGSRAFKHLTDALGTEYGSLSAVAGPACGAAFGDVLRQSGALALPVLAYTPQAPPAEARPALLAAGDARGLAPAWAALFAALGWRRVAVLSDMATRPALGLATLGVDVVAHLELPETGDRLDEGPIVEWAERVAAADGRVLYVCVEDARAVRAALKAGRHAGLRPGAGAVWLLPAELAVAADMTDMAEGHLSLAWEWAERWRAAAGGAAWRARWAARCGPACAAPPPHAALLYDVLSLWASALTRLARDHPDALDDLHREHLVGSLIKNAIEIPYTGLTGRFEWDAAKGGAARAGALVLRQWRNGSAVAVGSWRAGRGWHDAGGGAAWTAALRWAGGAVPGDGAQRCSLQALAGALHAECRVAFAAVSALGAAALAALLAGAACHRRRRAEREYRARLAALGARPAAPAAGAPDRWEVPRERVVINRKLGTGAFGTVYGGHALLGDDRGWTAVAVKTLKAGASTEEKLDFLSEAEAMKRLDHENVVRLLGVVTKTEPVCTVMEFMLYGDLRSYLLARRQLAGARGAAGAEVGPARLTALARDAARALSYLARRRYVHRDVAARNCLLSAQRRLKLADFGMTRLVFEHDYYRLGRKGLLPVRWMAPESLTLGVFSPASDVWSFGVLLYEIVTFGALPFQGLSNAEVLARVKAGHTVDLPPGLKPQLEALIRSCWRRARAERPTAAALAAALADSPRLVAAPPCADAPLDALPLALEPAAAAAGPEARWESWAAPPSAGTDSTYVSSAAGDAPAEPAPAETDAFLPPPAPA